MKSLRLTCAALLLALGASTVAASAAPAITTAHINIRSGPGTGFGAVDVLTAGSLIDVGECRNGFCQLIGRDGPGWVSQTYLNFDAGPRPGPGGPIYVNPIRPQPTPPIYVNPIRPQPTPPIYVNPIRPPVYSKAEACFFAGRDFRGPSMCLDAGESLDRLPPRWIDRVRSVEINGGAEVELCSQTAFYGNCVTLRSDTARLPVQLDGRTASVEVY